MNTMSSPLPSHEISAGKRRSRSMRANKDRIFVIVCITAATLSVITLVVLLGSIFFAGVSRLNWQFLSGTPSRFVEQAGIWPAMAGTIAICLVCGITAVPIGVATAILLEEYKPRGRYLQKLHSLVQTNITNLAGVPSIVYGILGLTVFVQFFNVMGNQQSPVVELGASYYDRFTLVDGTSVRVEVEGGQPLSVPSPNLVYMSENGQQRAVKIVEGSQIEQDMRLVADRFDRFEILLEEQIDALRTMDAGALQEAVKGAIQSAEVSGNTQEIAAALTPRVAEAVARPGREGKRALRAAVKQQANVLAAKAFPDTLLSTTVASRIMEPAPWYLRIPFGRSVLAGGLTLMLVILPIIIISTQEALRAISSTQRQASLALGATKWQTIWNVTLPSALPGMMTGIILAMSRAIGEAAPVLIIAGIVYITFTPRHLMDDFTAMPLQIYQWASLPQKEFHAIAAAGIILLLAILLAFNTVAIVIRQRTQKQG